MTITEKTWTTVKWQKIKIILEPTATPISPWVPHNVGYMNWQPTDHLNPLECMISYLGWMFLGFIHFHGALGVELHEKMIDAWVLCLAWLLSTHVTTYMPWRQPNWSLQSFSFCSTQIWREHQRWALWQGRTVLSQDCNVWTYSSINCWIRISAHPMWVTAYDKSQAFHNPHG